MKLELRVEDGQPIIFFLDEVQHDKTVTCYTREAEHSSASRAYMRSLPKPVTQNDMIAAWSLMQAYASHVRYCMRL